MSDSKRKSQLWHDFIKGIHIRSVRSVDGELWSSWAEAGEMFYGKKYNHIYDEYDRMLMDGEIDE